MPVIHGLCDEEKAMLIDPVDLPELEGERGRVGLVGVVFACRPEGIIWSGTCIRCLSETCTFGWGYLWFGGQHSGLLSSK